MQLTPREKDKLLIAMAAIVARKRLDAERKKKQREREGLLRRIAELEGRIAEREAEVKQLEGTMAAPGFYDDPDAAKAKIEQAGGQAISA